MIGIEGAIELVVARLQAQMPAKVAEVAARYTDDATVALRTPATYTTSLYARVEYNQYPIVEVAPRNDGPGQWDDQTGGVESWMWPYTVRVYVVERGTSFPQVEKRRQRLTVSLREVLTSSAVLQESPQAWIDKKTIRSGYFATGLTADADNRSIASTWTDLTVMVQEMTEPFPPATATANSIVSTVGPIHPAMGG